ncbi:MAG: hypothetical protein AVDCRST_MAG43-725 [uncultured Thermomicrobiales bacterium]|uniref:Protein kinase domain-containing protein n=1 Tax=uncultured Thermomicrobiales bacterium TaxID=1645740 RepID=A0A6J4UFJ2_9BACT|nr:MAG: hypothetical protein AVDCRST_MAG43-725 [uncultured Thermomicrobiales bacterium]
MDRIARFQNALLQPDVPEFQILGVRPELDHAGRPVVVAGNNAMVAKLIRRDGRHVAFRAVDNSDMGGDWLLRHTALQQGLNQGIRQWIPAGIRVVRGRSFADVVHPGDDVRAGRSTAAVAMEWIEGPTLMHTVDRAARAGNAAVLRALGKALRECMEGLAAESFVHGDITAHNIIVRPSGRLTVVDFDTATWPGSPLGPGGTGAPGYRHPTATLPGSQRDEFATLVLLTSLAVLADEPDLRRSFGDPVSAPDGVLIFSPWDLQDLQASPAYADISARVSGETAELMQRLAQACQSTADNLPGVLDGTLRVAVSPVSQQPEPSFEKTWHLDSALERIRSRYGPATLDGAPAGASVSKKRDGETLSRSGAGGWPEVVSPDVSGSGLWRPGNEDDRIRLVKAIERDDENEVAWLWARLASDPFAVMHAGRVEDVLARGYHRRIDHEVNRGHDDQVIALAEEASERNLPLPRTARVAVRSARERRDVRAELERALREDDTEALADLAVSGRLVVLGDADRISLQRVLRAIERPILDRALATDDDRIIMHAYDPALFDGDLSLGREERERIELASTRQAWVDAVRTALKQRRTHELFDLFTSPPQGGAERLGLAERRRIRREIERRRALDDLAQAVKGEDDEAIIVALNKVERVGARITDRFTWGAIQRVVERVSVIEELSDVIEQRPLDYVRLAQLLSVVRSLGLTGDPRLQGDVSVDALQRHVVRFAHVRRLRAALQRDNDIAIVVAAIPDPYDALDELTEEERDRVAAAIIARRAVDRHFVDARVAS